MSPSAETTRISIMDTTLRDGEQTPDVAYTPEEKIQIARLLVETGIRGLGCLPGEGGGGDDGPGARPLECVAAFGQPGVAIGDRHRFRRTECRA